MHLSKKEDQDKVKAWITEPTYRVEKKFAEAQVAPSWHNFVIAVSPAFQKQRYQTAQNVADTWVACRQTMIKLLRASQTSVASCFLNA